MSEASDTPRQIQDDVTLVASTSDVNLMSGIDRMKRHISHPG